MPDLQHREGSCRPVPSGLPRSPLGGGILRSGAFLVACVAAVKVSLHLVTAAGYGYFRDEFYFMDAGQHLALGYVDFPPFVAFLAAALRVSLGDSLLALRALPALAGGLVVLLTGLMARSMGAGRWAQVAAALASLFSVTFLVVDSFFSMNPFDELWWVLLSYVMVLLLRDDRPHYWLPAGLIAGVGLLTKESMVFFGLALAMGILASPVRRHLSTPWPWLGAGIALLCILPYLAWNYVHGWPTIEFWRSYQGDLINSGPVAFLLQQIQTMNPWTLPLWALGLYCFLFTREGRTYRAFGLAYIALFFLFVLVDAKPYFLAPAYPVLFAGGARFGETVTGRARRHWVRPAYLFVLVSTGLLLLPLGVPILPPALLGQVYGLARRNPALQVESRGQAPLPQWFADRFGWGEMAGRVARAVSMLTPEERGAACVLASNYGEAGALGFYRQAHGLPPVISGHDNYYLWGPGPCRGDVIVSVGVPRELLEQAFADIRPEGMVSCAYCLPEESSAAIYIARKPRRPLQDAWPLFKRFGG